MKPGMSYNTNQLKHAAQSKEYSPQIIEELVLKNISNVMAEFYEMQSQFLAIRYKMNHNIETSNILTFLCKNYSTTVYGLLVCFRFQKTYA